MTRYQGIELDGSHLWRCIQNEGILSVALYIEVTFFHPSPANRCYGDSQHPRYPGKPAEKSFLIGGSNEKLETPFGQVLQLAKLVQTPR